MLCECSLSLSVGSASLSVGENVCFFFSSVGVGFVFILLGPKEGGEVGARCTLWGFVGLFVWLADTHSFAALVLLLLLLCCGANTNMFSY